MKKESRPALGLDIGTSRIVTARHAEGGFRYESQLNAFVTVPFSKVTESVLDKAGIAHTVAGPEIFVHGNDSERFADLLNAEVRRPMTRGVLNAGEPESARFVQEITRRLTGEAANSHEKVCFTVPAAPLGADSGDLTYHEATVSQILRDLDFEPKSINEALAVIYSELEDSNYTGIGISFGGGLCNVCFAYLSVPILTFSVPKAGDFIDASTAAVVGDRANRIRMIKEESFFMNGHFTTKLQQVLTVYYDDMMRTLITALNNAFEQSRNVPKFGRPVPLVISGGTAAPRGFAERFEKMLQDSHFPVPLSEVRLAADPLTATAKGALVAALTDLL